MPAAARLPPPPEPQPFMSTGTVQATHSMHDTSSRAPILGRARLTPSLPRLSQPPHLLGCLFSSRCPMLRPSDLHQRTLFPAALPSPSLLHHTSFAFCKLLSGIQRHVRACLQAVKHTVHQVQGALGTQGLRSTPCIVLWLSSASVRPLDVLFECKAVRACSQSVHA